MLESFKLLILSLPGKARMDTNYYVGGFDEGGACRASCFALPGRELRISGFFAGKWTTFDGKKLRDISDADQARMADLKWEIPHEISAVDGLVRAMNPLHRTVFEETGYPE